MRPLKFLLFAILFSVLATTAGAQNAPASGLLFQSQTPSISQRTSLDLFDGKAMKFTKNFTISFDLSIIDVRRFGYVMRLINQRGEEIKLVFVNFRGGNNFYLDFHSTITNAYTQIRVPGEHIGSSRWVPVRIEIDLDSDKATITLPDGQYECTGLGLSDPDRLQVIFGCWGTNLDVPSMALRNVAVHERGKLRYLFPLSESQGETAHDSRGRAVGKVTNPAWLVNNHFIWQQRASLHAGCTDPVAWNPDRGEVYIIGRDSLSTFDVETRSVVRMGIERIPFEIISGEALYNPRSDACWIYNLGDEDPRTPSMAILDMRSLKLTHTSDPDLGNRLHHHNVFFDAVYDTLYIFGGYGNFTYSPSIYRYDVNGRAWEQTPLKGERVNPRFFASLGQGRNPDERLVFGGFGNSSGRQELGGKNLYDLISLDIPTGSATKLWERRDVDSLFVPCSNLILEDDRRHFVTLCYPHHVANAELHLYRFAMDDGRSQVVSSAIPVRSDEIATQVYLFYHEAIKEYVAVIREFVDKRNSQIRIFTLSAPVVSADALTPIKKSNVPILLYSAIVLSVLCVTILILRRRPTGTTQQHESGTIGSERIVERRNAIYVLGDFTAFDSHGRDITYRFSPKLRLLTTLLATNSREGGRGIPTEKLSAMMWPERDFQQAKNIRGVTMSNLRTILQDIEGVSIVHDEGRWSLQTDSVFYCDFLRVSALTRSLSRDESVGKQEMNELSMLISRGNLLTHIYDASLDGYRSDYERMLAKHIGSYFVKTDRQEDNHLIFELIEAVLTVDLLDEDLLHSGISALHRAGKGDQAHKLYNKFALNYRQVMGTDFPRPLSSFEE